MDANQDKMISKSGHALALVKKTYSEKKKLIIREGFWVCGIQLKQKKKVS